MTLSDVCVFSLALSRQGYSGYIRGQLRYFASIYTEPLARWSTRVLCLKDCVIARRCDCVMRFVCSCDGASWWCLGVIVCDCVW